MKKLLITTLAICSLCSCQKYLDVQPYGKTIPKTAEEFNALLQTKLNGLDNGNTVYFMDNADAILRLDAACGDDFETYLTSVSGQRALEIYVGSVLGKTLPATMYRELYATIRDCNIIIEQMTEQSKEADKIRATAYALRAVCYYQLLRYYAEAPEAGKQAEQLGLPLELSFNMESRPLRSTMQATTEQIEQDLKKSIEYHNTDELYRFTESVAKGYLARLYFWTEQWERVIPLANELLATYPILQANQYTEVMKQVYVLGSNQLIKAYRASSTGSSEYTAAETNVKFRPISQRFLSHFPKEEQATDVRYKAYTNGSRVVQKPFFCGVRSEELLLMKAESQYHLQKSSEALTTLNALRSARVVGSTPYTETTLPSINDMEIIRVDAEGKPLTPLLATILSERRKELFFEGDRFFEQKRNGTPEYWTALGNSKYYTRKFMYTFPIPINDTQIIEGLIQNPGYAELATN